MRLKEFFERLPRDGWWLTDDGEIRRGREDDCECPVSTLGGLPSQYYMHVADAEGLSRELADIIAAAADDIVSDESELRLRKRLLRHCGLSKTR